MNYSHDSPRLSHVKEEPEQDQLQPTPPPSSLRLAERTLHDTSGAPPPSSVLPSPLKKRRVTISGAPALNTDVRVPPDQTNSTPISPVVIGFTVQRDDPIAVEQVRSMLTVKQKQKALIEQRRGSVAGVMSPSVAASGNTADDRGVTATKTAPARSNRRSPNSGNAPRRHTNASTAQGGGPPRPPSPSPVIVPSQQPSVPSQAPGGGAYSNALPPPPISFARRRATQLGAAGKRKPADIVISPREEHTQEQFAPSIQSAPPIPHAGQGYSGRFPMTLPRLPSVLGAGDNTRRPVHGVVPPTPTRFAAMQRNAPSGQASQSIPGISGRSPPTASVAISSHNLVPPTPSSLHHPGYSGDKSAFLAPFEVFYDALNDSKQLKNWLGDQLQRSNQLMQSLAQQQEHLNEVVESLAEKKVSGMRAEMGGLYRRVEELEDALRAVTGSGGRRSSIDAHGNSKGKAKQPLRNGMSSGPMASDTYTFPPVSAVDRDRLNPEHERVERKLPSPGWGQDRERDLRETQSTRDSENGSPAPFDSRRRLSVSASRLDPPPLQRHVSEDPSQSSQPRNSNAFPLHSPPQSFREPSHPLPPPGKMLRGGRPVLHRQHSSPRMPGAPVTDRDREMASSPPPSRREEGRRNSVVMAPPDEPMDDRDNK